MEYPFKDLMPLDEATARDGYYEDWTHIDADTFHQISELVQFIREKGYGADTREAIAQALERVYHDAAISGNANMEVSMARKHFEDLASRLDASDDKLNSAATQLAQKVSKDEVANGLTAKGSSLYENLPTVGNEVGDYYYSSNGDGTNPAGNYVWNGTTWYFGGTGDEGYGKVNKTLNALTEIINIIDDTEVIDNRYYSLNSPTLGMLLTGDNTVSAYPLKRLTAGKYYHYSNIGANFSFGVAIFDNEKGFVKAVTATEIMTNGYFQMENDGYVGVSVLNSSLNKVALVEEKYGSYLIAPSSPLNTIPPHIKIKRKIVKTNTVIVDKEGSGDYASINGAIMSIKDDSAMNKYTIIIYPGTYNEVIDLKFNRFISLVGVNKTTCIIRNDNGTYEESPIQISGDSLIKNLTVISTHDNNPTLDPSGNKGYAIHADYNGGSGTLTIDDCILISHNSSALGCGTYANQTIECINSEFTSILPPNYLPKYGAIFAHSNNSPASNQKFKMRNCKITSNSDYSAFFANSDNSTLDFELINNNFYSSVNGKADESILESKNPVYNARSFGNNVSKLNK